MKIKHILMLFTLAIVSTQAWAFPLPQSPRPDPLLLMPTHPNEVFQNFHFTNRYDFRGIVALSNCSGSLIRFQKSEPQDAAMILTNGHCLDNFIPAGKYVFNRPNERSFDILGQNADILGEVHAQKILYATMTGTDITIYQLKETFAEIQNKFKVSPFLLAKDYGRINSDIEVISGYWKRGYRCKIERFVYRLKEGKWTFWDSIRYSRPGCNIIGGTSGSPIILKGSRVIVGVNNTHNTGGPQCAVNSPCEIEKNGRIHADRTYAYGQQTSWIYSCLEADGKTFNLRKAGCKLTPYFPKTIR